MRWLAQFLAGPVLWALLFSAVYGLHGAICAGLTGPEALPGSGRAGLVVLWLAGLLAHALLIRALPSGPGLAARLPRLGGWIGLAASAFTLFPVVFITSC